MLHSLLCDHICNFLPQYMTGYRFIHLYLAVSVFPQRMWYKPDLTAFSGNSSLDIAMPPDISCIRRFQRTGIRHPVFHQQLWFMNMTECHIIIAKCHNLIALDRNVFLITAVCKQYLIFLPSFRDCMIIDRIMDFSGMITASIDSRLDSVKFHTIDLLRTDHMHVRCPGKCPVIRIFLNIVMIAGNHDHLRMFQHLQYGIHFF